MRVAVTATGPSLDSVLDPRFGRCSYLICVNTDDMSFEAIENPNLSLGGGAGIQSAQLIAERDVKFVLTGNCGPNAHQTLSAAGISVIVGCSGNVSDAVGQFKSGQLRTAGAPNVTSHFGAASGEGPVLPGQPAGLEVASNERSSTMTSGTSGGGGWGRGRGMGRGMGRGRGGGQGMGRGMGGGRGGGRGMGGGMRVPPGPPVDPLNALGAGAAAAGPARPRGENPEQEVLMLKAQAEAMMAQLQAINARISQIRRGATPAPSEITEPKARRKASRDVKSPQMAAIVDEERCVSCGVCVDVCPEGAITESVTVLVDLQKCTGCGLCIDECPNEAISLTKLKAAAS